MDLESWTNAHFPLPFAIDSAAIANVNNIIYLIGGYAIWPTHNTQILKLDLSSSSPSWSVLSDIFISDLDCAHQCSTVIHNRYIYIYHQVYKKFIIFDAKLEDFLPPIDIMPQHHFDQKGCILSDNSNEIIYKIGSFLHVYNISSNKWNANKLDYAQPPSHYALARQPCVYHPYSHSIIAFPSNAPVIHYKIASDAWNTPNFDAIFTQSREYMDAILMGKDRIFIIAGTEAQVTNAVNVYNPSTTLLTNGIALNTSCGFVNSVSANGRIYIFGGSNNKSEMSNLLVNTSMINNHLMSTTTIAVKLTSFYTTSVNILGSNTLIDNIETQSAKHVAVYFIIGAVCLIIIVIAFVLRRYERRNLFNGQNRDSFPYYMVLSTPPGVRNQAMLEMLPTTSEGVIQTDIIYSCDEFEVKGDSDSDILQTAGGEMSFCL